MLLIPRMKLSDRITWAVLLWIFVNLLWLRFLESIIPQWVGAILITAAVAALVVFGPRPKEAPDDDEEAKVVREGEGR
jgi:glycerol uptake facilitator-like aquaporin